MAENTEIAWCDHTVNFWWGCTKVSPACANCYAEGQDARWHCKTAAYTGDWDNQFRAVHWGPDAPRLVRIVAATKEAMRYERRAIAQRCRFRVFTNSMSDFFEDRRDLTLARIEALDVIRQTPHLDWLVLTKRPERILALLTECLVPTYRAERYELNDWLEEWFRGNAPANVCLGTTIEDQQRADQRIPALLQVPAAVRFISCEPLLGPVDLGRILLKPSDRPEVGKPDVTMDSLRGWHGGCEEGRTGLDWVICGGESGPRARPMHPDWARGLRDQCAAAGVPFLFKQWGEWAPDCLCGRQKACPEMKRPEPGKPGCMFRCGKKAAGRLLDGVLHDAFPEVPRG